jgi:hypothetical protein
MAGDLLKFKYSTPKIKDYSITSRLACLVQWELC